MRKLLTLCVVHNDTHVLLGMRKGEFGEGKWNGFGGKVNPGENIEEAARRELQRETGLIATGMEKRGVLEFVFEENPEVLEVHIFDVFNFEGDHVEAEGVIPQWFVKTELPFDLMWPDDEHWLPLLFSGKNFNGKFYFTNEENLFDFKLEESEV